MNSGDTATAMERRAYIQERRGQKDRRRHSWRTLTYCGLQGRGRRRQARREDSDYYLDWYEPGLVIIGLGTILLSCVDALLTLTLLQHGAYEANQFMAKLLEISVTTFVTTKIAITCSGILFLLMHSRFHILKILNGEKLLKLAFLAYSTLVVYQLVLLELIT